MPIFFFSALIRGGLAVQDKELRLLMTQNRLLVNDFDPEKQRYVEKSKVQKAAGA